MLVLFLTPFNAVMLGFWMWIGGWLRQRLLRPAAGGVKSLRQEWSPGFDCLISGGWFGHWQQRAALASFPFSSSGSARTCNRRFGFVLTAIGIVYLTGAGVYLWHWRKIHSGIFDLVINQSARTLDLPQTYGRKQPLTVNIADIESFTVETLTHTRQQRRHFLHLRANAVSAQAKPWPTRSSPIGMTR